MASILPKRISITRSVQPLSLPRIKPGFWPQCPAAHVGAMHKPKRKSKLNCKKTAIIDHRNLQAAAAPVLNFSLILHFAAPIRLDFGLLLLLCMQLQSQIKKNNNPSLIPNVHVRFTITITMHTNTTPRRKFDWTLPLSHCAVLYSPPAGNFKRAMGNHKRNAH